MNGHKTKTYNKSLQWMSLRATTELKRYAMKDMLSIWALTERYEMDQYKQGSLDGLCGVYSIINASKIINDFNDEKCIELFQQIVRFLDNEKCLSKLLINGIDINIIGQIMNNVSDLKIKKEQPFRGKYETKLGEFWSDIQNFLEKPYRAILIGLGGIHDHWTVVESISAKQMKLVDSDGLKHLNRKSCTTGEPRGLRKHQVYPTYTYFLCGCDE